MKIYWHGKTCFEIIINEKTQDPVSIIIDPVDETYPKKDTNILLLTHDIKHSKEKVFTVSSAGEYEVKDVYIQAIPLKAGGLIYIIKGEGVKLCHLGVIQNNELSEEDLKNLGTVNVLFIEGGEDDKTKMIKQIEPSIIIPMNYENPELFLKRLGENNKDSVDYYKVQQKDLEGREEAEIIVLNKK
ncbi:MAG: MBL fold metallo-hydrolase [Candidatus Pacebacteria bacterium]|nr:MBL fold metallo-hydrolase [Candidatus Paceibacterota bacterium]